MTSEIIYETQLPVTEHSINQLPDNELPQHQVGLTQIGQIYIYLTLGATETELVLRLNRQEAEKLRDGLSSGIDNLA